MSCILSADARFSPVNFADDQIWELTTGHNEPPALALQTTYGLRAHWMRIFPSFTSSTATVTDPRTFAVLPTLETSTPSYARVTCAPYQTLDVRMEFWVPASNIVTGKLKVTNIGDRYENWKVAYNVLLNPIIKGQKMTTYNYGMNTVLQGNTQNVTPVFYVTGGPEPTLSPYPALILSLTLQPGQSRTFTWALASFRSLEESFSQARQMTGRSWDSDLMQVEMALKRHVFQINTSEPEWDRVFVHSQRQALQLLVQGPSRHPGKTFVLSRRPDHGYSLDGNGNDYKPSWIGQTALDAWAFCKLMLPGYPEIARDILDAFVNAQRPNGFISNQFELTNHLSPDHAFPILAATTSLIFSYLQDGEWLRQVYPALVRYLRYWFYGTSSEEPEELPTWSSTIQAGLDDIPAFDNVSKDLLASMLPHVTSPALYSLLFNECSCLEEIAQTLDEKSDLAWLGGKKTQLQAILRQCWNSQSKSYRSLDIQAKMILRPQKLVGIRKDGKTEIEKELKAPGRITLEVTPALPSQSSLLVTLHGRVAGIPVSVKITAADFKRTIESSRAFCPTLFDEVDSISVRGLADRSKLTVEQPNSSMEEITQLLPLWAGVPAPDVADQLVRKTILPRYRTEHGLDFFPRAKAEGKLPESNHVSLIWNLFAIAGLERYGYRKEASEIMRSLILRSSWMLAEIDAIYPASLPGEPQVAGDPDSLKALIPALDFIHLLGVDHWSEADMLISDMNTFFAPITVEYNRIRCTFLSTETVIQTLNGESQAVTTPPTQRILFP